jgi:hypothetical protein
MPVVGIELEYFSAIEYFFISIKSRKYIYTATRVESQLSHTYVYRSVNVCGVVASRL